jgi:hypothetical protein
MCAFTCPAAEQLPRRFDVHFPDGTVLARQSSYALREGIYTGKVPITARLKPDVGSRELIPVYAFPWFAQIYALLGVEPPAHAGTRRIAGWVGVRKPAAAPAPPPAKSTGRRVRSAVENLPVVALLAAGIGSFFLLLLLVALYISV